MRSVFSCVFQSRALNAICQKTVQVTSDPSKSELTCLEEVHITNVKPGEGLVSFDITLLQLRRRSAGRDRRVAANPRSISHTRFNHRTSNRHQKPTQT